MTTSSIEMLRRLGFPVVATGPVNPMQAGPAAQGVAGTVPAAQQQQAAAIEAILNGGNSDGGTAPQGGEGGGWGGSRGDSLAQGPSVRGSGLGISGTGGWTGLAGGLLGGAAFPGGGLIGGAIGTGIDVSRANRDLERMGYLDRVDYGPAALAGATFGLAGRNVDTQINDIATNAFDSTRPGGSYHGPYDGADGPNNAGGGWSGSTQAERNENAEMGGMDGTASFANGGVIPGYADGGSIRPQPRTNPQSLLAMLTEREAARPMTHGPGGRMTMPNDLQSIVDALKNNAVGAGPFEGAMLNVDRVMRGDKPMGPQPQGNVLDAVLQQLLEARDDTSPEERGAVHRNIGHMKRYDSMNPAWGPYDMESTAQPGMADGGEVPGVEPGSYVIPAAAVAALGNGSSNAGLKMLERLFGAMPVSGPGDGRSDSIDVGGISLSNDEAVIPPEGVEAAGGPDALHQLVMASKGKLADLARTPAPRGAARV